MERQGVHRVILNATARLQQQPQQQQQQQQQQQHQHRLVIQNANDVNRRSVQYMADFLRGSGTHEVNELELRYINLVHPPDGGLNVLCNLLANDSTLTTVALWGCHFGNQEEAARLVASLQGNRSVIDLSIVRIANLEAGAPLGNCISGVIQNSNTRIQRLSLGGHRTGPEAVRAFQPGLQANQSLKELRLSGCDIRDEGICLIADALIGNTTMEILDIRNNFISSNGLDNITRILENAWLKVILFGGNDDAFNDNAAARRFGHVLSRNESLNTLEFAHDSLISPATAGILFTALESNTALEEMQLGQFSPLRHQCIDHLIASLPRMKGIKRLSLQHGFSTFPTNFLPALRQNTSLEEFTPSVRDVQFMSYYPGQQMLATINILARNRSIHRAKSLLALQPRTGLPIAAKSGLWCMAMARLGHSNSFGASAIFDIFQKRPALLERQLSRPPPPAQQQQAVSRPRTVVVEQEQDPLPDNDNNNACARNGDSRKRARPSA